MPNNGKLYTSFYILTCLRNYKTYKNTTDIKIVTTVAFRVGTNIYVDVWYRINVIVTSTTYLLCVVSTYIHIAYLDTIQYHSIEPNNISNYTS